jgi:hypothetical protein
MVRVILSACLLRAKDLLFIATRTVSFIARSSTRIGTASTRSKARQPEERSDERSLFLNPSRTYHLTINHCVLSPISPLAASETYNLQVKT